MGAAGCRWIGGCCALVASGWFWRCLCLETLLSLEIEGSCEDILYDEIYIMLI